MSNRAPDERRAARTEARRRARLAARGELHEPDHQPEERAPVKSGGFLSRIFPAAPPLPNRPDPLAGYDGSGPLRPVTERLYLLRHNLLAWIIPGLLAFAGLLASLQYATSPIGFIGTFVMFGGLIGAGWFGWQRPTLYGTAAGLLAFFIASAVVLLAFAQRGAGPETFGGSAQAIGGLTLQAAYQAGLGFLGGWYGGYLRRRQTQLSHETRRR